MHGGREKRRVHNGRSSSSRLHSNGSAGLNASARFGRGGLVARGHLEHSKTESGRSLLWDPSRGRGKGQANRSRALGRGKSSQTMEGPCISREGVTVFATCPRFGETVCNIGSPGCPDLRLFASKGRPATSKRAKLLLKPEAGGLYSVSVEEYSLSSSGPLLCPLSSQKIPETFAIQFAANGALRSWRPFARHVVRCDKAMPKLF